MAKKAKELTVLDLEGILLDVFEITSAILFLENTKYEFGVLNLRKGYFSYSLFVRDKKEVMDVLHSLNASKFPNIQGMKATFETDSDGYPKAFFGAA